MNRPVSLAALAVAAGAFAAQARAAVILDTGVRPAAGALFVDSSQWLATRFELSAATRITDAEGYLSYVSGGAAMTISLYNDGAGAPRDLLFYGIGAVPPGEDWRGLHGLDWRVGPGAYWLAFEVRPGQSLVAGARGAMRPAPLALAVPGFLPYEPRPTILGIATRIAGDRLAAPEPAAWMLLIVGFGLAGATLRVTAPRPRSARPSSP